jgi:hypothetical protein
MRQMNVLAQQNVHVLLVCFFVRLFSFFYFVAAVAIFIVLFGSSCLSVYLSFFVFPNYSIMEKEVARLTALVAEVESRAQSYKESRDQYKLELDALRKLNATTSVVSQVCASLHASVRISTSSFLRFFCVGAGAPPAMHRVRTENCSAGGGAQVYSPSHICFLYVIPFRRSSVRIRFGFLCCFM